MMSLPLVLTSYSDDTGFDTLRRSTELFQQDSFNEGSCYEDRLAQSKSHQLHIVLD